jgi:hypothetical protein
MLLNAPEVESTEPMIEPCRSAANRRKFADARRQPEVKFGRFPNKLSRKEWLCRLIDQAINVLSLKWYFSNTTTNLSFG